MTCFLGLWTGHFRTQIKWKSAQRRRKHCALAVVRRSQKFSPRRRPFYRGTRDGQNLISWRWSPPLPTNPVWWGSMHAVSSYRGNRPTNKHTNRQDRLQYTAPQLARSVTNQHKTCGMRCAVRPPVRTLLYSHAHPSYLLVMPATVMTAGLFCPWQYFILNALNTRTSGVTPIGQGWTNARGLRDLGGPKLDPIFCIF